MTNKSSNLIHEVSQAKIQCNTVSSTLIVKKNSMYVYIYTENESVIIQEKATAKSNSHEEVEEAQDPNLRRHPALKYQV